MNIKSLFSWSVVDFRRAYWLVLFVVLTVGCISSGVCDELLLSTTGKTGGLNVSNRWMFDSHTIVPLNRFVSVTSQNAETIGFQVSSVSVSRPTWAANRLMWAFQNAYTSVTGETPAEAIPSRELSIRASLFIDDLLVHRITFAGNLEVDIQPGSLVWSDPVVIASLPAMGQLHVRTYSAAPIGGGRPGRRQFDPTNSHAETHVFNSGVKRDALRLIEGGSVGNKGSYPYNYAFGPVCQVADNWDGRPVVLIVGDSIAAGNDNSLGASWLSDALRSPIGGVMGYYNLAIHGTRPSNQTGSSQFGVKAAIVDSLVKMNNGALPMTVILSEMGVNDAGSGDPLILKNKMQAWFDYLHQKWPSAKLIQTTFTPRGTGEIGSAKYNPRIRSRINFDRWEIADWIKTKPKPLDGYIDVRPAWTGRADGTDWYKIPWQGELVRAAQPGDVFVTVNTRPPGDIVPVFYSVGLPEIEVADVAIIGIQGKGPYVLKLGKALKGFHAIGSIVRATMSVDGLHPARGYASQRAQAVVEEAKLGGLLKVSR